MELLCPLQIILRLLTMKLVCCKIGRDAGSAKLSILLKLLLLD